MSVVKVRFKRGDSEIEVEGTKSEVEDILRVWWQGPGGNPPPSTDKNKPPPRPPRSRPASATKKPKDPDLGYDPLGLANSLKENTEYSKIEKHVLHKSNMYNKIALVLRHSDAPLTSGQVVAVLLALNVKADVGNISNCIKANSGKLIPSAVRRAGGAKPKYKLTSQARTAFDEWFGSVKD